MSVDPFRINSKAVAQSVSEEKVEKPAEGWFQSVLSTSRCLTREKNHGGERGSSRPYGEDIQEEFCFESLLDHNFAKAHRPLLPIRDEPGIVYFFYNR